MIKPHRKVGFFYFTKYLSKKYNMKKVIKLTESDLMRIVKRVMNESKKFGSFDDEEWYDESDKFTRVDDMGDDFDDEEFDDFDSFSSKHGHDTKWFGKGDSGRKMFDTYKDKHSKPFKVRTRRGMDEQNSAGAKQVQPYKGSIPSKNNNGLHVGSAGPARNLKPTTGAKPGDSELLTSVCNFWNKNVFDNNDKIKINNWTKKKFGINYQIDIPEMCSSQRDTLKVLDDTKRQVLKGIVNNVWM